MGKEFDQINEGAAHVIGLLGNTGNLVETVIGEYDPDTGTNVTMSVNHITDYVTEAYALADIATGVVTERDVLITFQTDLTVDETWQFRMTGGELFDIINIARVTMQDDIVLYQAQARGAA